MHHGPYGSFRCIIYSFSFFFLYSIPPGQAQVPYRFRFQFRLPKAYDEIIKLKLSTGQRILEIETKKNIRSGNLIPYFLDNYIDFFTLYFQ